MKYLGTARPWDKNRSIYFGSNLQPEPGFFIVITDNIMKSKCLVIQVSKQELLLNGCLGIRKDGPMAAGCYTSHNDFGQVAHTRDSLTKQETSVPVEVQ